MSETNSLMNMPKRQLAGMYERLVLELMQMWSATGHKMADWVDPISAVRQIAADAEVIQKVEE